MKVIQLFKAKMEAFRDKNLQKVKNDQNFIHLAFVFPVQMKTTFLRHHAVNLAQTNGLTNILLDHDFEVRVFEKVKFLSRRGWISKAF